MSRVIKIIFLTALSLLLSASPAHGTQYIWTSAGAGTANGSSVANAMSAAIVNAKSPPFNGDDHVSHYAGDVYNGTITINSNGGGNINPSAGHPVYFDTYVTPDLAGVQATINGGSNPAVQWTDSGGFVLYNQTFTSTSSNSAGTGGATATLLGTYTSTVARNTLGFYCKFCNVTGGTKCVVLNPTGLSANCGADNIDFYADVITNGTGFGEEGLEISETSGSWSTYPHFSNVHIHNCKVHDIGGDTLSGKPVGPFGILVEQIDETVPQPALKVLGTSTNFGCVMENNQVFNIGINETGVVGPVGLGDEVSQGVAMLGNVVYAVYASHNSGSSYLSGRGVNYYYELGTDGAMYDTGSGSQDILVENNLGYNAAAGIYVDGPTSFAGSALTGNNCTVSIIGNIIINAFSENGCVDQTPGVSPPYSVLNNNYLNIFNNTFILPAASSYQYMADISASGTGCTIVNNILINDNVHNTDVAIITQSSFGGHTTDPAIFGNLYQLHGNSSIWYVNDTATSTVYTSLAAVRASGFRWETLSGNNYGVAAPYQSAGDPFWVSGTTNTYDADIANGLVNYPQSAAALSTFTKLAPLPGTVAFTPNTPFLNVSNFVGYAPMASDFIGGPFPLMQAGAIGSEALLAGGAPDIT